MNAYLICIWYSNRVSFLKLLKILTGASLKECVDLDDGYRELTGTWTTGMFGGDVEVKKIHLTIRSDQLEMIARMLEQDPHNEYYGVELVSAEIKRNHRVTPPLTPDLTYINLP